MIPIYSDRPLTRIPYVTILLVAVNLVAFWFQMYHFESLRQSILFYGVIPLDLFSPGISHISGRANPYLTILSSMFMHGGYFHLGSNMLYLWVFGRNVEDDFGHLRFFALYMTAGVLATMAFVLSYQSGRIPLVGASGAIAGVLGVFFLRFPTARIYTLFFLIIIFRILPIPAFFLLGVWFIIQLAASMTEVSITGHSGVAWISHVAGFIVGIVWTLLELKRRYFSKRV